MKSFNINQILFSLATAGFVSAQSFCSSAKHSGQSVTNYSNTVSTIGDVGYELWADSGSNSATFYSDGSFSCSFQNAGDYLCRAGLSFDSTQSHQQIGHMYADFKLVKQNIANVDYSFVGVYGWTRQPLVEYYIVDNWLSQYRPADWVGDTKFGDFVIDGAEYTVYKNTRTGPSIDGDTTFTQYFSIRKEARDCGTIDISAHFAQWEKLGMKLGVMHEAKVLGEAGSNNGGTSGTADFPYAKVYINNNVQAAAASDFCSSAKHSGQSVTNYSNTVSTIGDVGYELWADSGSNSATFYSDGSFSCSFQNAGDYLFQAAPAPAAASNFCSSAKHSGQSVTNYSNTVSTIGDVGYELWADSGSNSATFYSDGSFSCSFQNAAPAAQAQAPAAQAPVQAAPAPAAASNFCSSAKHSGQSVTNYSNTVSTIGDVGYELWADSGSNSATFYSDGSFSCSFQNAGDYLCRAGLSFDSTQSHQQIGHMYADFKLVKQNIANVDYSFVGVYGWTRQPLVEYYIVDNWLSQYRPADWVGDTKFGDFVIDGAEYTVYKNTRTGPSIDGDTTFTQYFSIRKEARDCGTIDISAHFAQWEKLGMKLGVMHEAKVLGEAGSNNGGTSGTADFPYAKVYI
ncbi:concanavalin A-like lectin/glucanase, partial [Neocallimastix californiae]